MSKIISVTGATGNVGSKVAEQLIAKGYQVRVIGRNQAKLERFVALGAEAFVGDLSNTAFLTKAFAGTDGVFMMLPADVTSTDVVAQLTSTVKSEVAAIRNSHVKQVVFLSTVGAALPEKGGVIQASQLAEKLLNELDGVNVVHLRPGYFMENFFGSIPLIKTANINGGPLLSDISISLVATQDVAVAAVKRFEAQSAPDKIVQYVLGERDLTLSEATVILGKSIDKPQLQYVPFSLEDAKNAFLSFGMSENFVDSYLENMKDINEDRVFKEYTRTSDNTTSTSIEQFVDTFAAVYNT